MSPEPRAEIYRFSLRVLIAASALALLLQAYLPIHLPSLALLDLPLLVVIYFGLSRRNPTAGLVLGLVVGLLQDGLSGHPIGQYGMAKTFIGFAASSLGIRLDTEQPTTRLLLVFGFYFLQRFIFDGVQWLLIERSLGWFSLVVLEAALVNAILAMVVFALLDRFRRPA